MRDRIIWQPDMRGDGRDFAVLFSRDFVNEMLEAKLSESNKREINRLGCVMLRTNYIGIRNHRPIECHEPFIFYENTPLVESFHINNDAPCMCLDLGRQDPRRLIEETNTPLKYFSGNVETVLDAHALLALVDLYAEAHNIGSRFMPNR